MEVRELLSRYDFPGDDIPIVQVSALKALEGDEEWENKIVELIQPIAMDEGLRFAIREGGRTVGAGVVTKVIK